MKNAPIIRPPERVHARAFVKSNPSTQSEKMKTVAIKLTGMCHEITFLIRRYAAPIRSASEHVSPIVPPTLPRKRSLRSGTVPSAS